MSERHSSESNGVDIVLRGGRLHTFDIRQPTADAIAIQGQRICAVGSNRDISTLISRNTRVIELAGRTVIPGLTDGHAHLDREGLKTLLPSLSGVRSIQALKTHIRELTRTHSPSQWLITMPLGSAPEYRWSPDLFQEQRLPDRHDLDEAAPDVPVLIRCAWGYWSGQQPLLSIANSKALALAGITASTVPPTDLIQIEKDKLGAPTGRIFEHSLQPIAEFTLFRTAPHFSAADRCNTLLASMQAYNEFGTTTVFEGHGVSDEVISAYSTTLARGQSTVRARLVFSQGFGNTDIADVATWVKKESSRLAGKSHDAAAEWLTVSGLFTETETQPQEARLRALCAPGTGWAGFNYDCALPREKLIKLLHAAAAEGLRVCTIQMPMLELIQEATRGMAIDHLRWVIAHPAAINAEQIATLRDLGIVITTLSSAYIWKRGLSTLKQIGPARENEILPMRNLLQAGVPVCLATDNVPVSLWPSISHVVARKDRQTGTVVIPDQRIDVEQALRCVTVDGAWLCGDEDNRGTLTEGKLADMVALPRDPLTANSTELASLWAELTIVDGEIKFDREANAKPSRPNVTL
jgi:hypothetical protein